MADKNFKSKAAYLKWIKYGHASGEFKETPGNQSVSIRNKNKKVEHTKYLDGGQLQIPPPDEATDADSLQVYNNAVQQQNYYNSLKEYYDKPTWKKTNIKSDVIKNITKEHLKHGNVSKTEKEKIKKGISSNIYYIKDMIPTAIDPNAPLAIYNPKIKPQGVIDYSPKGGLEINKIYKKYWNKISNDVDYIEGRKSDSEILSKYLSDNEYKKFKELEQINLTAQSNLQGIYTQLPYYSPLANKPAKLLTDKEVIKRFNQFGPSGISKERLKSLGLISKSNNTTTTSTSRTNTSKTSTPKIVKKEEPILPEVVLDPSMFPEQQPIFDYVEPVATPTGKTNKIISYSAEPLMIKDATTGRLIKNPNRNPVAIDTQGNKIEQKAYGGQLQPPPDEPTFQDSLDVYNNSMKVQKYYNALPSEKTVNYLNAYKAQKKYSDSFLKDVTNKNKNVTKKISNDPDKYFFKDEIYGAIDENAPDIEYNTKIAPQGTLTYAPKGSNELYKIQKELRAKYKGLDTYDDESLRKNLTPTELKKFTKLVTTQANSSTQMPGQEVSVPYYSPLAIKPAKLLTDEEIIERVKKYGPTGIDPKKIESLGINIKALNKTTKPTTTKKVIPTTKPVEQVIIPTTVQKDSINTAVEQVITPTGKTNKVPGGIISYTSQPRFTKDKYGRVIPNTNTQTKENFVGYKQEKAYGGYINKIDAPEIGGYFRLKNQMADGGELQLMPNEDPIYTSGQQFLIDMANSPKFAERYARMSGKKLEDLTQEEVDNYRNSILQNVKTLKYAPVGEEFENDANKDTYAFYRPVSKEDAIIDSDLISYAKTLETMKPKKRTSQFELDRYEKYKASYEELKKMHEASKEKTHRIYQRGNDPYTELHEESHGSTAGNLEFKGEPFIYDTSEFNDRYKKAYDEDKSYLTMSTEQKARVDAARKYMLDKGLYDPTKEDFNEKTYDKLIEERDRLSKEYTQKVTDALKNNTPIPSSEGIGTQIMEITAPYSKEDSIRMFNSFVRNDVPQKENVNSYTKLAKYGGYINEIIDAPELNGYFKLKQ